MSKKYTLSLRDFHVRTNKHLEILLKETDHLAVIIWQYFKYLRKKNSEYSFLILEIKT